MLNTTNFGYKQYEGTDLFNPLIVEAANIEAIDENERNIELKTVGTATELISGTVHALTRADEGCALFRFTATANFTAGETFTVDGQQVTALLTTGEQLGTGAYIIGSEVLCCLRDTLLTVYCNAGTVTVADDANKLGGKAPEYYGTAADTAEAVRVAQSANAISLNNQEAINSLNQQIVNLVEVKSKETTLYIGAGFDGITANMPTTPQGYVIKDIRAESISGTWIARGITTYDETNFTCVVSTYATAATSSGKVRITVTYERKLENN